MTGHFRPRLNHPIVPNIILCHKNVFCDNNNKIHCVSKGPHVQRNQYSISSLSFVGLLHLYFGNMTAGITENIALFFNLFHLGLMCELPGDMMTSDRTGASNSLCRSPWLQ